MSQTAIPIRPRGRYLTIRLTDSDLKTIIKTARKITGMSRTLRKPVICVAEYYNINGDINVNLWRLTRKRFDDKGIPHFGDSSVLDRVMPEDRLGKVIELTPADKRALVNCHLYKPPQKDEESHGELIKTIQLELNEFGLAAIHSPEENLVWGR